MLTALLIQTALAGELPLPQVDPGRGASGELSRTRGTWRAAQWTAWSSLGVASTGTAVLIGSGLSSSCCYLQVGGVFMLLGGGLGFAVSGTIAAGSAARGAHVARESGYADRSGLATGAIVASSLGLGSLILLPAISVATEGGVSTTSVLAGGGLALVGVGTGWVLAGNWWGYANRGFQPRLSVGPGSIYVTGEF